MDEKNFTQNLLNKRHRFTPTMSIDLRNYALSKVPVQHYTQLDKGTQVSIVREMNGVAFDHHGVYIGFLDPSKESHQNLLRLYPHLRDCPCIVDMTKGLNGTCVSLLEVYKKNTFHHS
jgi:hypothetical protein